MAAMPASELLKRKKHTNWREDFDLEIKRIDEYATKKAFYKDFSAKHNISWETVKKYHSTIQATEVEKTTLPDKSASTVTILEDYKRESDKEQHPSAIDKLKLDKRFVSDGSYYVGCLVECKVHRVEPRFVKVVTTDGYGIEGLVYIAEISHHFVEKTEDHFMFGDIFIGEVISIDGIGRLKLTTKGLFIRNYRKNPPKARQENPPLLSDRPTIIDGSTHTNETLRNSALADKLAEAKDSIVMSEKLPESSPAAPAAPSAVPSTQVDSINSGNDANKSREAQASREIEQVRAFVSAKLGFLSEGSEGMLQKMIDQHGIVNFTMAMAQVLPSFECDLGIYFAKEIDSKLSGGL